MQPSLSLASHIMIADGVVFRDLQGEMVLLNLQTGVYFGLDQVGTRIWQLLQDHRSVQAMLERLLEEYNVAEAQCRDDLMRFIAQGLEKGLFELHDGTAA